MPKSKRNKVVSLTKVKKRPRDAKDKQIEEVREACSKYPRIYVVSLENERNVFLSELRRRLRPGKLICAKKKLMQLALGNSPAEESEDGVHKITKLLTGPTALLFTSQTPEEVQMVLDRYHPKDFARAGALATETVTLARGPDALAKLPHSIEAHLRALGLPTQLVEGKIHLLGDHSVCKAGESLSADAAQVLKLLEKKQAEFSMEMLAHWHKDGGKVVVCEDTMVD